MLLAQTLKIMFDLKNLPDFAKLEVTKSDLVDFARVLAHELKSPLLQTSPDREIVDITEAESITGYARQSLYTLTSTRGIPHFKRGKKLYFRRSELEAWLLQNRRKTVNEMEQEVGTFHTSKKGGHHGK